MKICNDFIGIMLKRNWCYDRVRDNREWTVIILAVVVDGLFGYETHRNVTKDIGKSKSNEEINKMYKKYVSVAGSSS